MTPLSPPDRTVFRRGTLFGAGLIVLAALTAYHDSFRGPFVFDDHCSIVANRTVRRLWPIGPVLLPPADGSAVDRRPVVNFSVALNYALGGTSVWGYHLLNFLAHTIAALILFGVIRRSLRLPALAQPFGGAATPLALVAALIWAVHPLQTNAVTYIIQRTEVLAGLFYLLTLYCTIRGATAEGGDREQGIGDRNRSSIPHAPSPLPCPLSPVPCPLSWYAGAVAACLAALGSKESAVSAPVVVLVYDRLFLSRSWRELWRRRWGLYLGLAATWGLTALLLARDWLASPPRPWAIAQQGNVAGTWLEYALLQFESITLYLRLCFWPAPLILDYGPAAVEGPTQVLPYAALVTALILGTALALRRRAALGFLGVWFFAILAPSSGVVPITPECAAEKRMYLPLAAVVLAMVAGAYRLGRRYVARAGGGKHVSGGRDDRVDNLRCYRAKLLAYGMAATAVAMLALWSARRNRDYRTEQVIWQDTAEKRPNSARAQYALGVVQASAGQGAAAIRHYRRSLELNPYYAPAHNNLGAALYEAGQVEEAIGHFVQAIGWDPDYPPPQANLAQALAGLGRWEEALAHCRRAVELDPDFAAAHNKLGTILLRLGRESEAIAHYRQAMRLDPGLAEARDNLRHLVQRTAQVQPFAR
jgi:tetratricopeptide (TPR) repeat protein